VGGLLVVLGAAPCVGGGFAVPWLVPPARVVAVADGAPVAVAESIGGGFVIALALPPGTGLAASGAIETRADVVPSDAAPVP
jgi:hypothetical protein